MAYEIATGSLKITLPAGGDLRTSQYRFVRINSSGQAVAVTAVTDRAIGVLQNNPNTGEECEIVVAGGTKLVSSAALDEGTLVGTSNDGRGAVLTPGTTTTQYIFGQSILASGAAGEIATVIVNCAAPARAA